VYKKSILLPLLVILFLASCRATVTPTLTTIPTATIAATLTPQPEALAEAPSLQAWIEDYVNAYGGTVIVNGTQLDADGLVAQVHADSTAFIQAKSTNKGAIEFFVVNAVPLAIRKEGEIAWAKIHLKDLTGFEGGLQYIGANDRIGGNSFRASNFFDEFNLAVTDPSWERLNPEQGVYRWDILDEELAMLTRHGMKVRYHAILFPTQAWAIPDWVDNGNFSKAELERIITDWITQLVTHSKALGISEWVVTNEPYIYPDRQNDVFYKAWGNYDYIDVAFKAARTADPGAILIYNDTNNHSSDGGTNALTRENINRLMSETVNRPLVDMVGIQAHLGEWVSVPDFADVEQTLKSYGVPFTITEFDYTLVNTNGKPNADYLKQADVYAGFLRAALKARCTEFAFWSVYDGDNWMTDRQVPGADPSLFNKQDKPKPAYYAALRVLFEFVK
jgi:GH35 family endo-1,4-beta-xylanase